jgi:LPXTG-motif cell wall-anchored protein
VGSEAPVPTFGVTETTGEVAQAGPTTTAPLQGSRPVLPTTGGQFTIPLMVASLACGSGAALLLVRRRPVRS